MSNIMETHIAADHIKVHRATTEFTTRTLICSDGIGHNHAAIRQRVKYLEHMLKIGYVGKQHQHRVPWTIERIFARMPP